MCVGGGEGLLDNFNEAKGMNLIHTTNLIPFNRDSTKPLIHLQHKFMAMLVGSNLGQGKAMVCEICTRRKLNMYSIELLKNTLMTQAMEMK